MGKIESTAVNELIELASLKPLDSDDALFAPPRARESGAQTIMGVKAMSSGRAASGTKTNTKLHAVPVAGESGGISRPSRLTGIAPLPAAPPVVSDSDPWAVAPAQEAQPSPESDVSDMVEVDLAADDDEPAEPPQPALPVGLVAPMWTPPGGAAGAGGVSTMPLPPLPPATLHRTVLGTPAPELVARPGSRKTLPPPVRGRAPTGAITVPPIPTGSIDVLGATMPPTAAVSGPLPLPRIAPTVAISGALPLPRIAPTVALPAAAKQVELFEDDSPTNYFDREDDVDVDPVPSRNKLIIPMIAVGLAGALLGTILALRGGGGDSAAKSPSVAAIAAPAVAAVAPPVSAPAIAPPASAPAVAPSAPAVALPPVTAPEVPTTPSTAAAPAHVAAVVPPNEVAPAGPVLVDVRFDSEPDGATVMLVDRGTTTLIGTTPTLGTLDPTRSYDVVFTAAGYPTRVEHFDPKATHKVSISYTHAGTPAHVAAIAPASSSHEQEEVAAPKHVATAPTAKVAAPTAKVAAAPTVKVAAAPTVKVAAPSAKAPTVAVKANVDVKIDHKAIDKKVAVAEPAKPSHGGGILMISSKPPCQIFIDGKATGLVTPQRSIALPPGAHNITLVNAQNKLKKTIAVQIEASKSTKLIQDLMK